MKILIVDDNLSKVGKLIEHLLECGVARTGISTVSSAMSARQQLRDTQFDMVVLDLMLPLREETEPRIDVATALLRDIGERDEYFKPTKVVGFTAFEDKAVFADDLFRSSLWTIVVYDPSSDEWKGVFRNAVKYLESGSKTPPVCYATDVCVVTALRDPEMDAVYRLPWSWQESTPLDDSVFVRHGHARSADGEFSVVAAVAPRMGSVATALLSAKLIERFRPRFIAMVGICAGVRGRAELGDPILFDPVWEWPSGKLVSSDGGSYLEPSPHQYVSAEFVNSRLEELGRDHGFLGEVRARWPSPPTTALRIRVAPGASGSAVVATLGAVAAIREQHRKLAALDMEAYGLCAAAKSASVPRPTAIVIKSVCDFADEAKSDDWQAYAAYTSAEALRALLERSISSLRPLAGT